MTDQWAGAADAAPVTGARQVTRPPGGAAAGSSKGVTQKNSPSGSYPYSSAVVPEAKASVPVCRTWTTAVEPSGAATSA